MFISTTFWFTAIFKENIANIFIEYSINSMKSTFKSISRNVISIFLKFKYLKLIIYFNDICINFVEIRIIIEWKILTNVKKMFNFLNFENFYRRFINAFNFIVDSLIKLIKKKQKCFSMNRRISFFFKNLKTFSFQNSFCDISISTTKFNFKSMFLIACARKSYFKKNKDDVWKSIVYFFNKISEIEIKIILKFLLMLKKTEVICFYRRRKSVKTSIYNHRFFNIITI